MESPRPTFALGPLEVSFKRREDGARVGWLGSFAMHVVVVALLMIVIPNRKPVAEPEAPPMREPSVPITFVDPLPRPQPPKPKIEEFAQHPPSRREPSKPLRMQPVPESSAARRDAPSSQKLDDAGRRDTQPAGGDPAGPQPAPSPGAPPALEESGAAIEEPKDILGRLREFKAAVEAPRPSKGAEGGGRGKGGISMPNLPSTGFGVGNLEFEGRDYDWENYGRQIHGIIWRAWHNRLLITASVFERWAAENRAWLLDHRNGVRFTILRTGQVVDVAIETPSRCYPLDDSATDALKEVVLPPLPADFTRESETVHARFIAEGEIRTMKAFLQQMKNAGYF